METKTCQNCKQNFVIEPEDFKFYEKISVPPPTFCPECRFLRRMTWRNEWRIFRKKEANSGKEVFSQYSPESSVKIYDNSFWYSDNWDATVYARNYDFKKDFFTQFRELFQEVPVPARSIVNLVNSDYSNNANDLKNCYLVMASSYSEDSAYLIWDSKSRFSFDLYMTESCELCYGSTNLIKSYKSFFSVNCESCTEVIFCRDCVGCTNCFGCSNLRNKSFHIFNEPYSKEEYFKKIKEFNLGSAKSVNLLFEKSKDDWIRNPVMYIHGRHNSGVSGDYIYESKNTKNAYRVKRGEDIKYSQNIMNAPAHDSYDYSNWGQGAELIYESAVCGNQVSNLKFCWNCYSSDSDLQYCIYCHNSSNLFGCIGLRNKQYCIFNKQYTKEEYEKLVPKIIQQMNELPYIDKRGRVYRYGEFFPSELSPSEYNVTVAQENFSLTKERALEEGYSWKNFESRDYQITVNAKDLPDHISDTGDNILDQIIGCIHDEKCEEECTKAFRIIPQELEFLRKNNIPLPRVCPNCRQFQRITQINQPKLYKRNCQCSGKASSNNIYQNTIEHEHGEKPCANEFETTYAPERSEIVYCESCYLKEVV